MENYFRYVGYSEENYLDNGCISNCLNLNDVFRKINKDCYYIYYITPDPIIGKVYKEENGGYFIENYTYKKLRVTNFRICKLLRDGADVHSNKDNLLKYAFIKEDMELINKLISEYGASIEYFDRWVCQFIMSKSYFAVNKILKLGADPNVDNYHPMELAVVTKNTAMLKLLISYGGKLAHHRERFLKITSRNRLYDLYKIIYEMEE